MPRSSCNVHGFVPPVAGATGAGTATTDAPRSQRRRNSVGAAVAAAASTAAERVRLVSERVSRESVGAAFEHPLAAGINVACATCEALLRAMPNASHEHLHASCALALHIVSDVLTASPY